MAKTFKGFTNQQTHQLLKEMGFTGPAQKDEMDAFLASSPSAASKIGRYAEIAKQRVEGGPLSGMGFAQGDLVEKVKDPNQYTEVSRITPRGEGSEPLLTSDVIDFDPQADPRGVIAMDPNAVPFKDPAGQGPLPSWITPPPPGSAQTMGMETLRNPVTGETYTVSSGGYSINQDALPPAPPEGAQVLKPGTPTPEVSPAAELLDLAQETYASSTRGLTAIQQAMSGKDPEEVYKTRDYTSVADGTEDEREAAGTALAEKLLQHIVNTTPLTPEEITKYDLNGDGEVNLSDVNSFQKMAVGLREPNEAFTEFFLNKYPTTSVTYQQALEEAELAQTQAAANVAAQEAAYKIEDIPSTAEALGKDITNPSSVLSQPTVYGLKVENNQLIDENTGQVATAASLLVKQAQAADAVDDPAVKSTMAYLNKFSDQELQEKYPLPEFDYIILPYETLMQADEQSLSREQLGIRRSFFDKLQQRQAQIEQDAVADRAETYEAVMSQDKVKTALETFAAATGTPSEDALMKAETMDPEDLAQLDLDAITLDTIRQIPEMKRQLDEGEIPTAALFDEYTKSEAAKFEGEVPVAEAAKFTGETPEVTAETDYALGTIDSVDRTVT
jgi:hypothetical protein